ncbi:Universal stress protein family protein [Pedobacter suwonensis]|uniref:Universal stress protein family protein n=1 Tax=Pedobacter suwonensis TaxID=332999 RepID=A0A1I0T1J5_9SPHI|nr:universal stress protein [Pedobacter suwonensis]SFA45557.1 Universal stress protein family protein [Pedobacter suwonensis]
MKTILALTDFSESAENASRYAYELAKRVKAHLMLCNAITVPLSQPIPAEWFGQWIMIRSLARAKER